MNTMWKTGVQVGLVLMAGGALMLTGGIAAAAPSASTQPGPAHSARAQAECAVLQLPGVDMQLSKPGACLSVLLPSTAGARSLPAPAPATPAPAPPAAAAPAVANPPAPVVDAPPAAQLDPPVGDASAPVQAQSLPYPCLDVSLPGLRISVGDASPPTECFVVPAA